MGALVYTVDVVVLSKQREIRIDLDHSSYISLFSLFLNINAAKNHSLQSKRQIRHM